LARIQRAQVQRHRGAGSAGSAAADIRNGGHGVSIKKIKSNG
jgi:hypothetical protein